MKSQTMMPPTAIALSTLFKADLGMGFIVVCGHAKAFALAGMKKLESLDPDQSPLAPLAQKEDMPVSSSPLPHSIHL